MLLKVRVLVVVATAAYRRDELDELGTTGCMCASGSAALRACFRDAADAYQRRWLLVLSVWDRASTRVYHGPKQ